MSYSPFQRPVPRARLTRFDSFSIALWMLMSSIDDHLVEETVVFVLDDTRAGVSILHVPARCADDVIAAVDRAIGSAAASFEADAVIVASVRPDGGIELDDHLRWLQIDELCDLAGLELLEWMVLGDGAVSCPRAVGGEPDRWHR